MKLAPRTESSWSRSKGCPVLFLQAAVIRVVTLVVV